MEYKIKGYSTHSENAVAHPTIFFHRSESPSQAFIITLVWLSIELKDIPPDKWSEVVISYDNVPHGWTEGSTEKAANTCSIL